MSLFKHLPPETKKRLELGRPGRATLALELTGGDVTAAAALLDLERHELVEALSRDPALAPWRRLVEDDRYDRERQADLDIQRALESCNGSIAGAAHELGISTQRLRNKLTDRPHLRPFVQDGRTKGKFEATKRALEETRGNAIKTAGQLGITPDALYKRVHADKRLHIVMQAAQRLPEAPVIDIAEAELHLSDPEWVPGTRLVPNGGLR